MVPALAGLLLALGLVAVLLARAGGDASMLVHAGPPWTSNDGAPASLTVQDADRAFDGQFFYRLGVAPWSTDETVAGVTFDLPSLRNARWGYGALAWMTSGGNTDLVPWSLLALNLGAAAAVGALGGAFAHAVGRHRAWGLLFVLWPGFAYSLSLDTSELVATVFVLAGLLAARRHRWLATGAALSGAILVRDTTAVVPFGFMLAGLLRAPGRPREPDDPGASGGLVTAGLVPLAVFGAWQLLQRARFGALPLTSSGDNNLSAPLTGFVRLLRDVAEDPDPENLFRALFAVGVLALIGLAAFLLRRSATSPGEHLAWFTSVIVVLLLNAYLWSGATAFMRAATEAGVLSIASLLAVRRPASAPTSSITSRVAPRLLPLLATALGAGWALTAGVQIGKLG